jgi:hypothetical protein
MRLGHDGGQLLQKLQQREFNASGAVGPRVGESVDEIPVGILFKPLKRDSPSTGVIFWNHTPHQSMIPIGVRDFKRHVSAVPSGAQPVKIPLGHPSTPAGSRCVLCRLKPSLWFSGRKKAVSALPLAPRPSWRYNAAIVPTGDPALARGRRRCSVPGASMRILRAPGFATPVVQSWRQYALRVAMLIHQGAVSAMPVSTTLRQHLSLTRQQSHKNPNLPKSNFCRNPPPQKPKDASSP